MEDKSGYQGAGSCGAAEDPAIRGLSEGASGRFSEQIEQADIWGRFAGTGAENPRMRGNLCQRLSARWAGRGLGNRR